MEKIRIVTDSASDMPVELEKKYDVDIISYTAVIGEKTYVARVDFDNAGCYELMREHDEIPKTSQITAFQFEEEYYRYFQEGSTDIIVTLINSHGSATYNNANMAIDALFEDHPECKGKINITCHDGGSYTGAYGHLVVKAAQMREEGKSADEINSFLDTSIPRRRIYFGMYSLKYAGKSGRIPSAAAFVGDKLGIKPVMKIWDHEITTAAKCRGDKKMISKIINMTMKDIEPGSEYQIVYGSEEGPKEEMVEKMTEAMGYGPTECYQIGIEVSANAGPAVIGTIFNVKYK